MVLLAGAALIASPAWAQRTAIVPDGAGSALAAGTTAVRSGTVTTIDGGTLAGSNLFHSFGTFNLAAGDTARWTTTLTDPAKVTNVISRVTGGTVSQIGGALDSTGLPKASFFFINPAGIVFGKGAQVNVPGAAWFSTGKQLRFADGAVFSATTASGSTFSVTAPQSFGFLGQEGDIALRETKALLANPNSAVGLVGANVRIAGAGIAASRVTLAAVGDQAAEVGFEGAGADEVLTGAIRIAGSNIAIVPSSGQAALIRGGDILLDNTQFISTGGTWRSGGVISISAASLALQNDSAVNTHAAANASAGSISVKLKRTLKLDQSDISSLSDCSIACAKGDAGLIEISADAVNLRRGASLESSTYVGGDAGGIKIFAQAITMQDASHISSNTYGSGNGGHVSIVSDSLAVAGAAKIASFTSGGSGQAGPITINTGALEIDKGAAITSATSSTGNAGNVSIAADNLRIDDGTISSGSTGCSSGGCVGGASGAVSIIADTLVLSGPSRITTSSASAALAGDIIVMAPIIGIDGPASIASSNTGKPLSLRTASAVAQSAGPFRTGSVLLTTTKLTVTDGVSITTNSLSGPAGGITVAMPERKGILQLAGANNPAVITTSSGPDTGGKIIISNPLAIISNGGSILAKGQSGGADVQIASRYFIQSADRANVISVDGSIELQNNFYDVSAGTALPSVDFLDASRVLLGQCAAARATGETSRISWRNTGPYAQVPDRRVPLALGSTGLLDGPAC